MAGTNDESARQWAEYVTRLFNGDCPLIVEYPAICTTEETAAMAKLYAGIGRPVPTPLTVDAVHELAGANSQCKSISVQQRKLANCTDAPDSLTHPCAFDDADKLKSQHKALVESPQAPRAHMPPERVERVSEGS